MRIERPAFLLCDCYAAISSRETAKLVKEFEFFVMQQDVLRKAEDATIKHQARNELSDDIATTRDLIQKGTINIQIHAEPIGDI